MTQHDMFAKLTEGFNALKSDRKGSLALHRVRAEAKPSKPNPINANKPLPSTKRAGFCFSHFPNIKSDLRP